MLSAWACPPTGTHDPLLFIGMSPSCSREYNPRSGGLGTRSCTLPVLDPPCPEAPELPTKGLNQACRSSGTSERGPPSCSASPGPGAPAGCCVEVFYSFFSPERVGKRMEGSPGAPVWHRPSALPEAQLVDAWSYFTHKGRCACVLGGRTDPVWFVCGACRKAVGRCPGVSRMGRGFGAPGEHFLVTEGD